MKHLGISGGSTKIAGLAGAAYELIENCNYQPDVISGISAGSILALPIIFKKWSQIENTVKNLKLSDFFKIAPVNSEGRFTFKAILRLIFGKESLGSEKNLLHKIREFISEEEFSQYKQDVTMPVVYIGAVDFATGSRKYFNLKEVQYCEYLQIVLASASIPIFCESVKMKNGNDDMYLFDCGVRDHIATPWILQNVKNVTESVSIYSRPEDYKLGEKWQPNDVLKTLERYVDITNVEISKSDEMLEDLLCEKLNVKQTKIFLPKILTSLYDVDHTRLVALYDAGRAATIGAF